MGTRIFHSDSDFTTGDIQRITGISHQSVIRNIDRGLLSGRRVPGSKHRRVSRESLIRWLLKYDLGLDLLLEYEARLRDEQAKVRAVLLSLDEKYSLEVVEHSKQTSSRVNVRVSRSAVELGTLFSERAPHMVVIDSDVGGPTLSAVSDQLRLWALQHTSPLFIAGLFENNSFAELVDDVILKPCSPESLLEQLCPKEL